jgi:cellulose synthase/poly-beta-1,6-N-acetylglucosamine synthase-like glycosyltransferase
MNPTVKQSVGFIYQLGIFQSTIFMISLLIIVVAFLTCGYLIILLWLDRGIHRLENLSRNQNNALPTASLIICAQNEENRLPQLLQALTKQEYPADKLEICLVDDRSTDRSGEIMADFTVSHPNVVHLRLDDTLPDFAPKKRAIDMAIRHTTGEIILLTDADSTPGPRWAQEMVAAFAPNIVMVCGYSPYVPRDSLVQKILALEYFSHAAVAAGGIGAGWPLTCTGSNLAYRRDAYWRLGGFGGIAQWISGDDDLLLHKMHRARIGKISYAAQSAAYAPVRPPRTWNEFKSQRTRYASKSLHYAPSLTLSLALVYLLNLFICAGLLFVVFGWWKFFVATLIIAALKAFGEYIYLQRAAKLFGEAELLPIFPLAAFLHPFYVVFFATLGQFAKFSWRGEQFTAKKRPLVVCPRIEESRR